MTAAQTWFAQRQSLPVRMVCAGRLLGFLVSQMALSKTHELAGGFRLTGLFPFTFGPARLRYLPATG
jgi:hypothetical protein